MSGTICYFVGGPLDLTKCAVERAEPHLYALGSPALTLSQINTKTQGDNVIDLIESRHRYRRTMPLKIRSVVEPMLVYIYDGQEYKEGVL